MSQSPSVRHLWPIVFANSTFSVSIGALLVNSILLSRLMWPAEPFHAMEMGAIITIMTWTSAISGLLVGRIADRHSRKKQLSLAMLLIGASFFIKGLLPINLGLASYLAFVPCFVLDGWGSGSIMPVVVSYTNDALDSDSRSAFFGFFFGFDQIAMIAGMLLGAIFFEIGWWRAFFAIVGILAVASSLFVRYKLPEPKRGVQHHQLSEILKNPKTEYNYTLNTQSIRDTFLRPTNFIAFVEGLFTCILIAATNFLIFPYLQSAPRNMSASSNAVIDIIFGLPGTMFGVIAFSKYSDKLGKRDIRHRLTLIAVAIFWLAIGEIILFALPIPIFTLEQGNNIEFLLATPMIWMCGIMLFSIQAVSGLYTINQTPILQAINLPEAQATIMAWNQFLQTIGMGIAPIIAGVVLTATSGNYFLAMLACVLLGIPGGILWVYGRRKIVADIANIDRILHERAIHLKE